MEQLVTRPQAREDGIRILLASSEAHPLIKTGGLADVAGSLPVALRELGQDARLIIPAYPRAVKQIRELKTLCELKVPGSRRPVRILGGLLPGSELPTYLVEAPEHFYREGNPYTDVSGRDWGDNPERFLLFCRVVARIGLGLPALGWRPEILHCNDWQTGLVPALLHDQPRRPALVFTIHNLAYQGLFDRATFERLRLPASLWSLKGLEFHHRLSFIKGGLVFSDRVNTVSPTYAEEVKTPRFGCGLDGLLQDLGPRFQGILNGIDYRTWDPSTDPHIPQNYDRETFELKVENKLALQRELGLPRNERAMVFGYIGRLVEQKGIDLILAILPRLMAHPNTQLVMQGAGDGGIEEALLNAAETDPERVGVFIGYDEGRAHRIEAGSDSFLMPSRFEPCGLNQMYSLRYGTVPVVHRTGGLADTVVGASPEGIETGQATGFSFEHSNADGLWDAARQAMLTYRERQDLWRRLAAAGMTRDFSWEASARHYAQLYDEALNDRLVSFAP
ncbi:MAG: glycogen synthase GlgA [Pseudomonadota bacterium]|nr:glycogen synthase GlgA [Pseudomonadota bacterium]